MQKRMNSMKDAPTPPWRMLFTGALMWLDGYAQQENTPQTAILLSLMVGGHIQALAFHVPAMWSPRVHRRDCMHLMEHMILYALVHALALLVFAHQKTILAAMVVAHCSFYFAWSTVGKMKTCARGCIVPWALHVSMLVHMVVIIPAAYVLAQVRTPPHHETPFYADSNLWLQHTLAWFTAEVCHYTVGAIGRGVAHLGHTCKEE